MPVARKERPACQPPSPEAEEGTGRKNAEAIVQKQSHFIRHPFAYIEATAVHKNAETNPFEAPRRRKIAIENLQKQTHLPQAD
jgi:hypothetical protein